MARGNIDYDQVQAAARQGTGAKFQMAAGAAGANGNVLIYDANGNAVDGGAPGSGTVTHTSGSLTSNAVILGNGSADIKAGAVLPSDATKYYDGTGAFSTPAGSGGGTVPTSGWTARNSIIWDDYLTPLEIGAKVSNNSSLNWRLLTQSLSGASTYTFIATVRCASVANADSQTFGVFLYDGTKLIGMELLCQSSGAGGNLRLRVERMNSVTSDNSTVAGPTANLVPALLTCKIVKDASHRTFFYYTAGAFTQFYQEANNAFMTETDVGFGGVSVTTSDNNFLLVELLQWSRT